MLNRLEQSMGVYAADGGVLGAIQMKFNMSGPGHPYYWVPAPGGSSELASGEPPRLTADTVSNPHLREFVHYVIGLSADAGRAFSALLAQGIDAVEQRTPDSDPTLALLIGRPLALVRAALRFETPGLPALDQNTSWTGPGMLSGALTATLGDNLPAPGAALLDTGGFADVNWPIRLGDAATPSDGLIGFFRGDPGAAPRPLFAAAGLLVEGSHPGVLEPAQPLALNCRGEAAVTMLMDPAARVHATSGVLPRVFLQLPGAESAGARQAHEAFFQTAPVLGSETTPHIPKPSDDYGQWSWACRPPVTLNHPDPHWREDPNLLSASDRESDAVSFATISEGWLRLRMAPVRVQSFWIQNGDPRPPKNSQLVLAWNVRGATKLALSKISGGEAQPLPGCSWSAEPLPANCRVTIEQNTIYEVEASDDDGNRDTRRLSIQVREG
jgi:hypothetical protein